ncbi:MAG: hypothetical protein WBW04_22420 [Nitrolancea sp.]
MLFDDFERVNGNPAKDGEPLFTFLNGAAGSYWQAVRDLLSGWVAAYPAEDRPALISRFRRTDRRGFLGAFWELYVHELFRRLDFEIELHPSIDVVTRHPDFRLRKDGASMYVEAVTIYEPQSHSADDERLAPVLDAISSIESPNYVVEMDARQIAKSPLPLDQLTEEIGSWLHTMDGRSFSRSEPDTLKWQDGGWSLIFSAIPRDNGSQTHTREHGVGSRLRRVRSDDESRAVRMRLGGKTRVYGRNLDAPFLIAFTSFRTGHTPEAVLACLFGPEATRRELIATAANQTAPTNRGEGFWLTSRGVRYQDASAVLSAFELMPWTVAHCQPWLIENPWATRPLEVELPFNSFLLGPASGEVTTVETSFRLHEHFGLPTDWPSCASA